MSTALKINTEHKQRILVIGNGMVGHHFVEQIIQHNATVDSQPIELMVLSAEPRLAYDRVHLSEFFSGKSAQDLALTTPEYYQANEVRFSLNAKAVDINKLTKTVTTEQGMQYQYDKLVLCTGSYPFVPPIPGNDQPHCLVYRTIEDLEAISASAAVSKVGVVVGGDY